jgi:DNA-binding XRE family transcriptional regulator
MINFDNNSPPNLTSQLVVSRSPNRLREQVRDAVRSTLTDSVIDDISDKELEMFSFDQIKDEFIGEIGTEKRTHYEQELQLEILGEMIRKVRLERKLTQEELGKLIGVQRAQISKLENNTTNVTMETILKVFGALRAKVNFNIELLDNRIQIAK